MDWDEIDGVGPAKVITRRGYYGLMGGIFVGLLAVGWGINLAMLGSGWSRALFRWHDSWPYWFNFFLARYLADRYLRWHGLSRSGPTVEVFAQAGSGPAGLADPEAVVEVRRPREVSSALGAFFLAACLPAVMLGGGLIVQALMARAPVAFSNQIEGSLVVLAFGAVCGPLGIWLVRRGGQPQVVYRADPAGFTDCARKQFFPWSSVASYRVTTDHDTLGTPTETTHELAGWDGAPLVRLQLDILHPPARARLLGSIQARLPKPVKGAGWD